MTLAAVPITDGFGAEIVGLDLSQPIRETQRHELLELFWRYKVVAIRGQDVSPDGFIRFAEAFGKIEPFFISSYNLPSHPQIYVLSNVRENGKPIGRDGAGTTLPHGAWRAGPAGMRRRFAGGRGAGGRGGEGGPSNFKRGTRVSGVARVRAESAAAALDLTAATFTAPAGAGVAWTPSWLVA